MSTADAAMAAMSAMEQLENEEGERGPSDGSPAKSAKTSPEKVKAKQKQKERCKEKEKERGEREETRVRDFRCVMEKEGGKLNHCCMSLADNSCSCLLMCIIALGCTSTPCYPVLWC